MLKQRSVSRSSEIAHSFVSNHKIQGLVCDLESSKKTSQKCLQKSPSYSEHQNGELVSDREAKESDSRNRSITCFKLPTVNTMRTKFAPNLVYKRRRPQPNIFYKRRRPQPNIFYKRRRPQPNIFYKRRNSQRDSISFLSTAMTNSSKSSGGCHSCSEMPSLSEDKECNLQSQIANDSYRVRGEPITTASPKSVYKQVNPQNCRNAPSEENKTTFLKSASNNICSGGEVEGCDEQQNESFKKPASAYCSNDSCSSSKSNVEFGSASIKSDLDETGESSSSDNLATGWLGKCLTEKDLCISILRQHGLLQRACPAGNNTYNGVSVGAHGCNVRSCKICGCIEKLQKMLICDHCEEAFHVSCFNPRIRRIPVNEWYCQTCSRKKQELSSKNSPGKSLNAKSEEKKCRSRTPKDQLGPISFMLTDSEPYTTDVRIGKDFQADVPDWSGPVSNDLDCFGEPLEMDPAKCCDKCGSNAKKSMASSSIGNWLQCGETLDRDIEEGTICGKWRRAPLFELQTDDWDCSCSVVWDPVHADCAVPQELKTEQVLKHLKYIEKLRPRLASKKQRQIRRKSD